MRTYIQIHSTYVHIRYFGKAYHHDDEVIIRDVSRQILTGTKAKPGLRFADLPKGHLLISRKSALK
jgi:hypothetical protein